MIGKIIAVVAVLAAVASAQSCGYITRNSGCEAYGTRFLSVGCSVPVVSATPSCSPIAVPSHVVDPIRVVEPTPVVSRVVETPVVSVERSGYYGGFESGSIGGCGSRIVSAVY